MLSINSTCICQGVEENPTSAESFWVLLDLDILIEGKCLGDAGSRTLIVEWPFEGNTTGYKKERGVQHKRRG